MPVCRPTSDLASLMDGGMHPNVGLALQQLGAERALLGQRKTEGIPVLIARPMSLTKIATLYSDGLMTPAFISLTPVGNAPEPRRAR